MKILAIETSCDDTCASILSARSPIKPGSIKLLSQIISSQEKLHQQYGGVFPSLAKREHQINIIPVITKALKEADLLKPSKTLKNSFENHNEQEKIKTIQKILKKNPELFEKLKTFLKKYHKPKIDKLAITTGPGLEPCLWVGVNLVKALSFYWEIPIVGVNHLEGHLLSAWLKETKFPIFPAIGLIVSGGNTQLILMKDIGKYRLLGETRDDAAGECFDKTARILGLGYPGGKEISKQAEKFKQSIYEIKMPRPMIYEKNFDFSFSGLKTAVLYDFNKRSEDDRKSPKYIAEISKEIQNSIIEVLTSKTSKAIEKYKAKSIILGGGVSANTKLRKEIFNLCKEKNINCYLPDNTHTADNASMIGLTAFISPKSKIYPWQKIKPNSNFKI
ncbi:MAG: tRNA (adenosine(37)-N6)-threonylcarbamoyltransferase complex transferase subunit TsaD [Candidatus Paceibacterota bacterium]|jgi:N6-L-threonylcarbamoyladenine synthase